MQSFCLPTLVEYQFIETHLGQRFLMQQAPFALVDMLIAYRYLPKAVVFHVGESDLGVTPIHHYKYVAANFVTLQSCY